MLKDQSIGEYLKSLNSKSHIPGGGSATALIAAQGLGLAIMACSLTIDKKGYESFSERAAEIRHKLIKYQDKCMDIAEKDMVVFTELMQAYKDGLPQVEINKYLERSAAPQVALQSIVFNVAPLMRELMDNANKNMISDLMVSDSILKSVRDSSLINIKANTSLIVKKSKMSI